MAVPYEMLLHPELLSNEKLVQIIQERYLRVQNLSSMSRPDLLELFHQFCVPYGQRKYRDSGRGKMFIKGRQTSPERILTLNTCDRNENIRVSCSETMTSNNNSQNRKSHHINEDRLRPTSDVLSSHMKRFKLDRSISSKISDKRKLAVDSVTLDNLATDCPPPKRERKPITWP